MTQVETTTSTGTDTVSYEHAADNTLAAVTDAAGDTTVVSRDAEDRPVAETEPGSGTSVETSDLTYAGGDRDAATVAEVGDVEARGVLEAPNGWLIAEHRDPEGYDRYFVTDHLGTAVQELDRSGVVKGTEDYDAYGADTPLLASGQMTTTVGFAGERRDAETGLSDHDARSYDAELRTWVTTDQYEDPSSDLELSMDVINSNRTTYAGADPINQIDPDGHLVLTAGGNLAPVQITSHNGHSTSYSFLGGAGGGVTRHSSVSQAVSAAQAAYQAKRVRQATAARWRNRPEVKAERARYEARMDARARRKSSCQKARRTFNGTMCVGKPRPLPKPKQQRPKSCDWKCKTGKVGYDLFVADAVDCAHGSAQACVWFAAGFTPVGKGAKALKVANKARNSGRMKAVDDAVGEHSVFKYGQDGRINGYQTYEYGHGGRFIPTKRFRGTGKDHAGFDPPYVMDPAKPGARPSIPRDPLPWELPHGY